MQFLQCKRQRWKPIGLGPADQGFASALQCRGGLGLLFEQAMHPGLDELAPEPCPR